MLVTARTFYDEDAVFCEDRDFPCKATKVCNSLQKLLTCNKYAIIVIYLVESVRLFYVAMDR